MKTYFKKKEGCRKENRLEQRNMKDKLWLNSTDWKQTIRAMPMTNKQRIQDGHGYTDSLNLPVCFLLDLRKGHFRIVHTEALHRQHKDTVKASLRQSYIEPNRRQCTAEDRTGRTGYVCLHTFPSTQHVNRNPRCQRSHEVMWIREGLLWSILCDLGCTFHWNYQVSRWPELRSSSLSLSLSEHQRQVEISISTVCYCSIRAIGTGW